MVRGGGKGGGAWPLSQFPKNKNSKKLKKYKVKIKI
jgi:hypothetical protein